MRADGLHRRRAARHGRLEPRARGLPPLLRHARRRAARCTCSTRPTRRRSQRRRATRSTSTRRCSSSPRSPAGRSRRCRSSSTSTRCQPDGAHFVAVTDPGTVARRARRASTASGACSRTTRRSAGATRALSYFGLVPAALAGVDVGAVLEAARGRRCRELPSSRRATPACGSASRSASSPAHGRDKLTFVVDDAARRRSACGPSSSSPSRPASRAAASCRSPTSRSLDPGAYGDDRVFLHLARRRRGRTRRTSRARARARPATRRSPSTRDGPDRPRADLLPLRVRDRGRRLGAGDQPVRPAQRAGGQGQHEPGARARARRTSTRASLDDAARRPRAARATWRSWATCRTPTRSRPRSRACARRLIAAHGVATTCGYGPRFLHSTGQFHKGGPPVGRFLQLVDEPGRRTSRSPASRTLRHADPRAGRRRPADAARPRPAAPCASSVGDIDAIKEEL